MNLRSDLKVQTPEGVTFSFALAGPVARCMAWCIDLFVIALLNKGIASLGGLLSLASRDIGGALSILGFFALSIGYGILLEGFWRGQTVGKRIMRLRVIDMSGLHLEFHQVVMRNLLRAVDVLPGAYLIGGSFCVMSKHAQRLGDLAAGTVVVHHGKTLEPDLEQLMGGKYNSLRGYPRLVARLRQRVSAEEAQLALQALVRRDQFQGAARLTLFTELASRFRELVPFPSETAEALSEEQYVRNVADILFNEDRRLK